MLSSDPEVKGREKTATGEGPAPGEDKVGSPPPPSELLKEIEKVLDTEGILLDGCRTKKQKQAEEKARKEQEELEDAGAKPDGLTSTGRGAKATSAEERKKRAKTREKAKEDDVLLIDSEDEVCPQTPPPKSKSKSKGDKGKTKDSTKGKTGGKTSKKKEQKQAETEKRKLVELISKSGGGKGAKKSHGKDEVSSEDEVSSGDNESDRRDDGRWTKASPKKKKKNKRKERPVDAGLAISNGFEAIAIDSGADSGKEAAAQAVVKAKAGKGKGKGNVWIPLGPGGPAEEGVNPQKPKKAKAQQDNGQGPGGPNLN
jgi:hypothetical protein